MIFIKLFIVSLLVFNFSCKNENPNSEFVVTVNKLNYKNVITHNEFNVLTDVSSNSNGSSHSIIFNSEQISKSLKQNQNILFNSPIIVFKGFCKNNLTTSQLIITSFDSDKINSQIFPEKPILRLLNQLDNSEPKILFDNKTASYFKIIEGEKVNITSSFGILKEFRVIVDKQFVNEQNSGIILINSKFARELCLMSDNVSTGIFIKTKDSNFDEISNQVMKLNLKINIANSKDCDLYNDLSKSVATSNKFNIRNSSAELLVSNDDFIKSNDLIIDEEEYGPVSLFKRSNFQHTSIIRNALSKTRIIEVKYLNDIIYALPYLSTNAIASIGFNSKFVRLKGVIPKKEIVVDNLSNYLSKISVKKFGSISNGILFGKDVASSLNIKLGSNVKLISVSGEIYHCVVLGIIDWKDFDKNNELICSMTLAQKIDSVAPDEATGIEIKLKDVTSKNDIASKLQKMTLKKVIIFN